MLAALHRLLRGQDELSFLRQLTTPLDLNFQPLSKQIQEAKDKRQTIKDDKCANIKLTRCFVTLKPLFGCVCYFTVSSHVYLSICGISEKSWHCQPIPFGYKSSGCLYQ